MAKERITLDPDFPFTFYDDELAPFADMGGINHWHDCLEISWVIWGTGRYFVEDRIYEMQTGDIIVINNMEPHRLEVQAGGMYQPVIVFDPTLVWSGSSQSLDRDYLGPFFDRGSTFSNRIELSNPAAAELRASLATILREAREKPAFWQLAVKAQLLVLLTHLIRDFSQETEPAALPRRLQLLRLEETIRLLETNYQRPISLEEAAASCHLSPAYFSAYFKKATGLGFVDWLNRYRINQAITLLGTSQHKITFIAQEVGFNNTATFNQSFRKFTGRTPSSYRRDL